MATQHSSAPVVCSDVTRRYEGSTGRFGTSGTTVTALDNVSCEITHGSVVGVAGPSGSGKSTLLHLLAGLDTPTAGDIQIYGTSIQTLSSRERTAFRRSHIGMVFQRFHLLPALTAVENVAVPLVQAGESRATRRDRATELLDAVGLDGRHKHRPGSLSGGEQQRVAIARALAADPAVVIADEPTGELDRETGEQVLDVLTDIAADRAVVIASHDEYTLSRTDRVINLRDGRRET
ncbi:ABC transporter ATP-binding protein [Halorubrum sp. Atlit-8R]|uniref:ABC transporter ATP-binding protein n=1 Tax=unclassified Halorubrum TaxID=2642239 RepID=UPI000EF274E1|nr:MULTISPECIES: ABC transporter ATP-binding protein [unclassified Halorubrum]RLM71366.1 ABC transporter ATP-binding protein [Halorubrum sp. Atlit-9R]RLM82482.1 ABC transporter ATP-binding protein [Halorubrum sp. Atlit-8R]